MNRREANKYILAHANEEVLSEIEHFRDVYEGNKEELNEDGEFRDTLSHFEDVLDYWGDFKNCSKGMAKNIKEIQIGIGMCTELSDWQLKHMITNVGKKYDFILNGKKYDCNSICAMDYYEEEPMMEG